VLIRNIFAQDHHCNYHTALNLPQLQCLNLQSSADELSLFAPPRYPYIDRVMSASRGLEYTSANDSTPSPPTILKYFDQPLPHIDMSGNIGYKSVKASGTTTANFNPPKVLLFEQAKELITLADSVLQEPKVAQSRLKHATLHNIGNEAGGDSEYDIVTASWGCIMYPIVDILKVKYGSDKFEYRSELSARAPTDIFTEQGKNEESVVRYDLVFKIAKGQPNAGKTIAIVEYKRRELIRWSEWQPALLPPNATKEQIGKVELRAKSNATKSVMKFNALSYVKQVAAYAAREKCKHVAIFNWDHALFFRFDEMKEEPTNNAGNQAKIIWSTEKKGSGRTDVMGQDSVHVGMMLKVMLGWFLYAFKDAYSH
jgi:hypothetical protein